MADRLTMQTILDAAARFNDVPARFAVRNEATRTVLQVALDVRGAPAPAPVDFIFGMPVVVDDKVEPGAIEVRDVRGRVLRTVQLFDVPDIRTQFSVLPHDPKEKA